MQNLGRRKNEKCWYVCPFQIQTQKANNHPGYLTALQLFHHHMTSSKSQHRGGKGIKGMQTIDDDYIEHMVMTTTHHEIMFFTNTGRSYRLKAYEIPESGRTARGTAIINLIQLMPGERITAMITMSEFITPIDVLPVALTSFSLNLIHWPCLVTIIISIESLVTFTSISSYIKGSIIEAASAEKGQTGKKILEQLKKNMDIAENENIPVCQDTAFFASRAHFSNVPPIPTPITTGGHALERNVYRSKLYAF